MTNQSYTSAEIYRNWMIISRLYSFYQCFLLSYTSSNRRLHGVEWYYLQGVLQKLGFAQKWINSVMRCVSLVRYSIKVNGELTVSVRNMVPTLTSRKRRGLSLNGRC
jgi:hypothetical protein